MNTHALPLNGPHGEAWLVWGILVALFLALVAISSVALWRASRAHKEDVGKDRGKVSEDIPTGSIDRGQEATLPVPPEKQKGFPMSLEEAYNRHGAPTGVLYTNKYKPSDQLLGHGITGEGQQAANEDTLQPGDRELIDYMKEEDDGRL